MVSQAVRRTPAIKRARERIHLLQPGCSIGRCALPDSMCCSAPHSLSTLKSSAYESVSHSVHSEKETRLFGTGLKFLAQAHQVRIYGTRCWISVVSPDVFKQALTAQNFTRIADEVLQQLELHRRKLDRLAGPRDLAG